MTPTQQQLLARLTEEPQSAQQIISPLARDLQHTKHLAGVFGALVKAGHVTRVGLHVNNTRRYVISQTGRQLREVSR